MVLRRKETGIDVRQQGNTNSITASSSDASSDSYSDASVAGSVDVTKYMKRSYLI